MIQFRVFTAHYFSILNTYLRQMCSCGCDQLNHSQTLASEHLKSQLNQLPNFATIDRYFGQRVCNLDRSVLINVNEDAIGKRNKEASCYHRVEVKLLLLHRHGCSRYSKECVKTSSSYVLA